MTIEEAIKQSSTGKAHSEDGSAEAFYFHSDPNNLCWSPTHPDRRSRLSTLKVLDDESPDMQAFLRGMTWVPDHPKDAVTLLGEVAHDEGA